MNRYVNKFIYIYTVYILKKLQLLLYPTTFTHEILHGEIVTSKNAMVESKTGGLYRTQ